MSKTIDAFDEIVEAMGRDAADPMVIKPPPPVAPVPKVLRVKMWKPEKNESIAWMCREYLKKNNHGCEYTVQMGDIKERSHKYIHISELYKCERLIASKMLGLIEPEKISPELKSIFDNGHGVHGRLTTLMDKAGLLVARNVDNKIAEWGCGGEADAIVRVGSERRPMELKSINEDGFNKLGSEFDEIMQNGITHFDNLLACYVLQVQGYLKGLGLMRGHLWFENKNRQSWRELCVERSDDAIAYIEAKCGKIMRAVRGGVLPDGPCVAAYDSRAVKCAFGNKCFLEKGAA